jgi:ATP/maltotriose-dependent transcriptional regulator MalT
VLNPVAGDLERVHRHGDAVLPGHQTGLAVDGARQEPHVAGCCACEISEVARDLLAAFDGAERSAYARLRLAEALLGCQGLRQQARAELAAAREVAVRLGARSLTEEVERLAIRARLGPARADPAGPDDRFGLTDRERDVLGLVCAGCTNRQIAARLYITPGM